MNREIDYFKACKKHPNFSRFIILKIELQRRGFILSEKALEKVDINKHQTNQRSFGRESYGGIPVSLMLRDGTTVITRSSNLKYGLSPMLVDVEDEKIVIKDSGEVLEEVFL